MRSTGYGRGMELALATISRHPDTRQNSGSRRRGRRSGCRWLRCEGADPDEVRAAFVAAVDAAAVGDVDGPNVTTSKDVSYLTGSGVVDGDPESAAEQVASGLRDDGWDVSEPAPAAAGLAWTS